jgi:protein-L-isoaspartate(D-aspartate) O-methyltransferase
MSALDDYRRFFAEEIQVVANLQTSALVDALATVPREKFLPPGPWMIRGEADFQQPPRHTPDAEPKRVYHNVAVAIDPARMLFNGAPGLLAMTIETLKVQPGSRALHVGTGPGYYTALMAKCAGPTGRVLGVEVDPALASAARGHLSDMNWVEIREGNGAGSFDEAFDAILINAGMTHPLPAWLEAMAPGGRMILPLTVSMPMMGPIGKGFLLLVTRPDDANAQAWPVRLVTVVAIYSALGLRDDGLNSALGQAMQRHPFPPIKSLRRDAHDAGPSCWLHAPGACLTL